MVLVASRARGLVVRTVPSPLRRAADAVAALGSGVPAEASLYLDLVGEHRPPVQSGLHVLRRSTAVALTPTDAG